MLKRRFKPKVTTAPELRPLPPSHHHGQGHEGSSCGGVGQLVGHQKWSFQCGWFVASGWLMRHQQMVVVLVVVGAVEVGSDVDDGTSVGVVGSVEVDVGCVVDGGMVGSDEVAVGVGSSVEGDGVSGVDGDEVGAGVDGSVVDGEGGVVVGGSEVGSVVAGGAGSVVDGSGLLGWDVEGDDGTDVAEGDGSDESLGLDGVDGAGDVAVDEVVAVGSLVDDAELGVEVDGAEPVDVVDGECPLEVAEDGRGC